MSYFDELHLAKKTSKNNATAEGQLTVDVFEDRDHIIVQSTVAGVSKDDLDIAITKDMVTIKGRRLPDRPVPPSNYHHQELYWGNFSRSVILPTDVDSDRSKASMKNGILTIRLPKLNNPDGSHKLKITE